ncbi:MAG TPA: pyridoxamine 5'-phosphate oxidase family protein, partial [Solirubrobacterales bacterium]|nr:pyridoxamine 5'-phosphate oxidase family protein [Solirubrobacterales bacterium]
MSGLTATIVVPPLGQMTPSAFFASMRYVYGERAAGPSSVEPAGSSFPLSDRDRIRALFEGPNLAHVATLMADGSPHVAPVWIGVEGSDLAFVKEEESVAMANLRRDPRVAISVSSVEDPYE